MLLKICFQRPSNWWILCYKNGNTTCLPHHRRWSPPLHQCLQCYTHIYSSLQNTCHCYDSIGEKALSNFVGSVARHSHEIQYTRVTLLRTSWARQVSVLSANKMMMYHNRSDQWHSYIDNNARAATTPTQHTLPAIPPIYIPIPMALSPSRVVSVHP